MKAFAAKIFAVVILGFALSAQATLVYSNTNSVSDLNNRLQAPNNIWFGDEVILAGSDRLMTALDFEYWATNTSGLTVDVELRLNDGIPNGQFNGYDRPGTLVYSLYGLNLSNTDTYGRSVVYFTLTDFGSPLFINGSDVTLALNFHYGVGGGEAGVDLYNPPTVGAGYPDYWQINAGSWELTTNNAFSSVNFGMRIDAVPEPSSLSLVMMGGLAALGFRRFFSKK